jgi:small subunit ribosomal protein S9
MAKTRRTEAAKTASQRWYGTGRRKEASARVYISKGSGNTTINGRDGLDYLKREILVDLVNQPFVVLDCNGSYDVRATVQGGGLSGQAGAIRHGIARALCDSNIDFRASLKGAGLLTRDARVKERKKYGQRGARARFQFSKR